jgi:O-antigen/teichoic acid export membrane protein
LGLIFGLIAVMYVEATPEALLFAYAAAQALGLIVSWPFTSVVLRRPKIDPAIWRAAWIFGGPLMISSAMTWVGNHAIRFIVEFGAGRAAVGMMTVGWWMGLRLAAFVGLLVMGAAFNVAVERIRREGAAAGRKQLAMNGAMLLAILVPSVVGVWLVGAQLVPHLVDVDYRETTAAILPIAMLAGAARVFREHGSDPAFLLFEKAYWPPYIGTLDAIATVTFCVAGLYLGGVTGAAWGCMLGAVAGAAASLLIAHFRTGFFIDWADVVRIGLATSAMSLPLLFLPREMSLWTVCFAAGVGAAIYGAVLAVLYPEPSLRFARTARERLNSFRERS